MPILTRSLFSLRFVDRYSFVRQSRSGRFDRAESIEDTRQGELMRIRRKKAVERAGWEPVPFDPKEAAGLEHQEEDEGFTLVELLVVVVIMGVLATVSVLGVRGLTDRGQESACESDRRVIEVAIETWFADESLATSGTLTEAALVDAQLLRDESTLFDVQTDGTVVPVVNGACDQA